MRAVSYTDIQSIEIDPAKNLVALRCGEEKLAIEADGLGALQVAGEVIRRARALDHDVLQMCILGDPMAGVGETVDPELLARFANTLPGVGVGARNSLLESCLIVRMSRADEVEMERRVAAFEKVPVRYIVEVQPSEQPRETSVGGPVGRLLH